MNIGMLFTFRNPPQWRIPFPDFYDEQLRQIGHAEALGYDTIWLSEHHFAEDGYVPSLLPLAGAVAARTTRIRIGTYLLLLPLHNAVRVAEDVAVLDVLSRGRFDLGIGLGYSPAEFNGYGVPLAERGSRMEEGIEVLKGLWTRDSFSFSGRHYRIRDARLTPRPVQAPHPPIWVGAFGPRAIDRAARFGCHYFGNEFTQSGFDDAVSRHGQDAAARHAGHLRFVHVAPTAEEAWRNTQEHLHYMYSWYARWGGDAEANRDSNVPPLPPAAQLRHHKEPLIGDPAIGTAEEVAEKLLSLTRQTRVTHFVIGMHLPGLDPALSRRSMELFARQVMPTLRRA